MLGVSVKRLVGHLLERNDRSAPVTAVSGHQNRRLRVVDAVAKRLGAESAEHHGVDRADTGASEHRDGELGNQRQIQRHAIAFADAELLQHVGELADLAVQIPIRQRAPIAWLTFPDERRLVAPPRPKVSIETVGADIQRAVGKPLGIWRASTRGPSRTA